MRIKVKRVYDGIHGWVWRWRVYDIGGEIVIYGWERDLGTAADRGRNFLKMGETWGT
jgi:hypothetical protein